MHFNIEIVLLCATIIGTLSVPEHVSVGPIHPSGVYAQDGYSLAIHSIL